MNTLLQLFTKKSDRWSQRLLSWSLALVMVIGVAGLLQQAMVAVGSGYHGEVVEQAFAQPVITAPVDPNAVTTAAGGGFFGGIGQVAGNVIATLATLFIKLLAGILWFVLYWMGDLMDNTFILQGDIGQKLHSVWVIVRNMVNIFFAMALVVVALMSVLGVGDESGNYGLKKFIPKMALALIAVNFTFFACRIVLDINNVLTTAIFDIPRRVTTLSDIGPTGTSGVKTFKRFECLSNNESFDAATQRVKKYDESNEYKGVINQLGGVCFAIGPLDGKLPENKPSDGPGDRLHNEVIPMGTAQYNQRNFVWTMATQFQGLHNLNKVSQLIDPTFTGLTVNALFSIIFAVIYGTAYIAMFIILIARMCVLWITIMLSPLVAISIVFPDLLTDKMDIQQQFLDHAFVPVKMAIPLALGYILISQMQVSIDTSSGITEADKIIDLSSGGEFARGVSITTLMYGVSSIAVIWFAVFTASEKVVGHGVVESLKGYVETAGSTVAKWPTYLPIFPISGTMASVANLTGAMTELQNQMRQQGLRKDEAFYAQTVGKFFPKQEIASAVEEIKKMVETGKIDPEKLRVNLSRLAAEPDPARFNALTKELGVKFGAGKTGNAELEKILDIKAFEVTDPTKLEAVRKRLGATGGAVAPTAPQADYSSVSSRVIQGLGALKLNEDASNSITEQTVRTSLGLANLGNDKKADLNFKNTDIVTFMNALGDATKVRDPAFKEIVRSDQFKGMIKDDQIRAQMALDPKLLQRLTGLVDRTQLRTAPDNQLAFDTYKLIHPEVTKESDIDSKLGIKTP